MEESLLLNNLATFIDFGWLWKTKIPSKPDHPGAMIFRLLIQNIWLSQPSGKDILHASYRSPLPTSSLNTQWLFSFLSENAHEQEQFEKISCLRLSRQSFVFNDESINASLTILYNWRYGPWYILNIAAVSATVSLSLSLLVDLTHHITFHDPCNLYIPILIDDPRVKVERHHLSDT